MSKATNAKYRKRIMERLKREGHVFVDPLDVVWMAITGRKFGDIPTDDKNASGDKSTISNSPSQG